MSAMGRKRSLRCSQWAGDCELGLKKCELAVDTTWEPSQIRHSGPMAEWLRRGLQILARRFDSGSGLHSHFRGQVTRIRPCREIRAHGFGTIRRTPADDPADCIDPA